MNMFKKVLMTLGLLVATNVLVARAIRQCYRQTKW